jgi:hypothetical protein
MCKKLNKWIQNRWTWMWKQTTLDERALAAAIEMKKRAKATAEEIKDVGKALKEVGNQIGDIDDAVMGKERRGRKSKD